MAPCPPLPNGPLPDSLKTRKFNKTEADFPALFSFKLTPLLSLHPPFQLPFQTRDMSFGAGFCANTGPRLCDGAFKALLQYKSLNKCGAEVPADKTTRFSSG